MEIAKEPHYIRAEYLKSEGIDDIPQSELQQGIEAGYKAWLALSDKRTEQPKQLATAQAFDMIFSDLAASGRQKFSNKLLQAAKLKPKSPDRVYLKGVSGCGKTTMIRIFSACADTAPAGAVEVQHSLLLFGGKDILKPEQYADSFECQVLVIDEFEALTDQVHKIMIPKFLRRLQERGIKVVFTSNVAPPEGLEVQLIEFEKKDNRDGSELPPLTEEDFLELQTTPTNLPPRLAIALALEKHRNGFLVEKYGEVVFGWLDFSVLSEPLGQEDYQYLVDTVDVLYLGELDLPLESVNDSKRLTILVDLFELHEKRVILFEPGGYELSSEDPQSSAAICTKRADPIPIQANRTYSRLKPMQGQ